MPYSVSRRTARPVTRLLAALCMLFTAAMVSAQDHLKALQQVIVTTPAAKVPLQAMTSATIAAPVPAPAPAIAVSSPGAALASKVVVHNVAAGELFHVLLSQADEASVNSVLREKLKTEVNTKQIFTFPGVLRVQAQNGTELQLKPYVLVGQPLVYEPSRQDFVGSIKVGVTSLDDSSTNQHLSAPVIFEILESQWASPAVSRVESTSPPFTEIIIRSPSVSPQVTVHVTSRFHPGGVAIDLPVVPTMLVHTDRAELQGYGLETTTLHVSLLGVPDPKGRVIELGANPSAFFDPARVILDSQGSGTAQIRSDGSGLVTITATSAGLESATHAVTFLRPIRTLAASGMGALGGALIRMLLRTRRGLSAGRFFLGLVVAVLVGVLVFGLYAIGVSVLPIRPEVTVGTTLVLVFSALGAFLGTGSLSALNTEK